MIQWQAQQRTYEGLTLKGVSVAGVSTCLVIPELKITFDVAQGFQFATNQHQYLITHGHMDHCSGIPYIISQKALTGQKPGRFYMPPNMIKPLTQIMNIWQEMEGHTYEYEFIAVEPGRSYEISNEYFFKIFPTVHRVPSNGYTVFRRSKKLKTEYSGQAKEVLVAARQRGEKIENVQEEPLISFTGDTKIEFLDLCPWIKQSKILIMEVTYVDEKRSVAAARQWGHIHLDELIPRLGELSCEKVVVIHLSSRHKVRDAEEILRKRLPKAWQNRVEVFPQ